MEKSLSAAKLWDNATTGFAKLYADRLYYKNRDNNKKPYESTAHVDTSMDRFLYPAAVSTDSMSDAYSAPAKEEVCIAYVDALEDTISILHT